MQQLIYPEPIVTSREQKTFENYLNINDKSLMVQDTAVDFAYPDYFAVDDHSKMVMRGSIYRSALQNVEPSFKKNEYHEFANVESMMNVLTSDLEYFYQYETFDTDSLDQVKFRKAIVQEINNECPYTDIKDNVVSWMKEVNQGHMGKDTCSLLDIENFTDEIEKRELTEGELTAAHYKKIEEIKECFNQVMTSGKKAIF